MPNWCFNELTVRGDADKVAKFKKKVQTKDSKLSFNKTVQMPVELRDTTSGYLGDEVEQKKLEQKQADNIKKYGYPTWYEWSIANWGTKWDACEVELYGEDSDCLEYSFETAWSPPVAWLEETAKQYPELEFRMKYEEEGMDYFGVAKAYEGVTEDRCV